MEDKFVIGVDLGGTKIYTVLAGADGRVLTAVKVPTEAAGGRDHVLKRIMQTMEQVREQAGVPGRLVRATVVGAPGPLDASRGVVYQAPNLGWQNVPLTQLMEEATGIPARLENDANLAALGEHVYGAGRGETDLVYITVSTGIGSGMILDGRLYRGVGGGAGEIGHMTVLPDGPPCSCGNRGCLEAMASGSAIAREARSLVAQGKGKAILAAGGGRPEVDAEAVSAAAAAGDPEAIFIIAEAARFLGIGLANVLNLLNPALVILGGGAMKIGSVVFEGARSEMQKRALAAAYDRVKLVPAQLGGRAGAMGAVALALQCLVPEGMAGS